MKLTILDGHALNPGDLSWDSFSKFADITVYERTPEDQVIQRIGDSDAILLNKINITKEILEKTPNLKYIGVLATGYNVIDTKACKEKGIVVTNIPSYSTNAVAQHVFSLILHFTNHVSLHNDSVQNGDWIKNPDFCYWNAPLTELSGKTLGILGFGNIGKQSAKIAEAFGMNVIVTPHRPSSEIKNCVSLDELWEKSDFITLHAPLNDETKQIINEKSINKMKKSAVIINTGRGGLVDEQAVRTALENGKIAGYAADVVLEEPMKKDNPLFNAPNWLKTIKGIDVLYGIEDIITLGHLYRAKITGSFW